MASPAPDFTADIAAIQAIDAIPTILDVVCRVTGMGFAAVARVTEDRWIACEVRDDIGFGLKAGGELKVETTICNEVRHALKATVIDHVAEDPLFRTHHTPAMYGFQSYISMPIIRRDGTFFGTLCAIDPKPAKLDDPKVIGLFELFADLIAQHLYFSDRVIAGAQLNASLEERVQQRGEELKGAQDELRQAQKMEAVGQLTGGLAHDFNNLLTGIAGNLELMQRRAVAGAPIADLGRYIDGAQGAVKRAAALTHRLLAFSRRQTLDPKPTDVGKLVAGIEPLIRQSIGPHIALVVDQGDDPWTVLIDANQLENAILNLAINARDAMPDGGRIAIAMANRSFDGGDDSSLPAGEYLSLSVSDNGSGMTHEVIDRAFDPFFTTKPIGSGTGLGLSMVYGFARQSGGRVKIASELGRGTTVSLDLPRHVGGVDREISGGWPTRSMSHGLDQTILIVDDEPMIRMLSMEALSDFGYVGVEAPDGASGLKILQSKQHIDLLITDVGLPGGMNGRQLADAGRISRPDLKVLFITGYAESVAVSDGQLAQGMEILTKPFTIDQLADRIATMLAPT